MDLNTALGYLNGDIKLNERDAILLKKKREVYYGMSLHTTGACPAFKPLDNRNRDGLGSEICPAGYYGPEYQFLFDKILFSRHPREHELTRQWRFSQYKPITKAPFQQITEIVVGAIFQDSQYDLSIQNEDENKYIWENVFEGNDLIGWYSSVGVPSIMEDPNGIIIRMPVQPNFEQVNQKVDIGVYFIKSKDIVYYPTPSNQVLIFKRDEYAYYVDTQVIFRFVCDNGKWTLSEEDQQGYYAHMLGKLPIDIAGGIWNTQGFYDSYLDKAKAAADEFVSTYSAEQMVDKEASHPFIVQANEECGNCQSTGKEQRDCDECESGVELVNCHICHGKGTISVSPGDRLTARKEDMQFDLVKIVNPDVAINEYHHKKNIDVYERILEALHLFKTDKAESGEAKAIDQERLYQFISKISNNLFDKHIYNSVSDIIAYRNIGVINGNVRPVNTPFNIQKPTQFQIRTAADLLKEYTESGAPMPVFMRSKMLHDFNEKQYAGDDVFKRKAEMILQIDDLSVLSADERLSMATSGEVSNDDILFSRKLPVILDEIIRDKGHLWFVEAKFDDIKTQVDMKFNVIKNASNIEEFPNAVV